jgi:hypothetical protein
MRTPLDDPDLEIPEVETFEGWIPNPYAKKPGEKSEVFIDGAVGYQLRLIPSNKVLGTFTSTLEAWPAIISVVERGRSPRTLSLDWIDSAGCARSISAGPRLEVWARLSNGGEHPYGQRRPPRVAETA